MRIPSTMQVFAALVPHLRKHQSRFLWGGVFILGTTSIEVLIPVVVGKAVDLVATGSSSQNLVSISIWFLILVVAKAILDVLQAYFIQVSGQKVAHDLRILVFGHICKLKVGYFDAHPTGRLLTRVVNDIRSLSELFSASISVLLLDCLIILATLVAMFVIHWKLALVTLIPFPIVVLTIHFYGKRLADAYRRVRAKLSEMNAFLGENIGAISTIQRLVAEEARFQKFAKIIDEHQCAQMESLRVFAVVQPIANILNGFSMSALIVAGGFWVFSGQLSLGVLVAFLGYLRNLYQPIRDLVEKYNTFLSSVVSAERVIHILAEPPEENQLGQKVLCKSDFEKAGPVLEFLDVKFKYPGRDEVTLDGVTFDLKRGESLALVGATGSGKSTILRLLLKYYPVDSGQIRLAGRSISNIQVNSVRNSIGVVHQETYLFQGTLRDNLILGRTHLDDANLKQCCERACLWDFVKLRGGLDFQILEGGLNLSSGERQLIAMARVLILDCPFLILDEATSSLDRKIETSLLAGVNEVMQGRTSITIAHRLTTVRDCDKVLLLDSGRAVEYGDLDSLMQLGGRFKNLYNLGLLPLDQFKSGQTEEQSV